MIALQFALSLSSQASPHANIIPLIGVKRSPVLSLVLPLARGGSLQSRLDGICRKTVVERLLGCAGGSKCVAPSDAAAPTQRPLSQLQRVRILAGIARGVAHLHACTPPMVHLDIKPGNVLLDENLEPMLADFGTATVLTGPSLIKDIGQASGTPEYMVRLDLCLVLLPHSHLATVIRADAGSPANVLLPTTHMPPYPFS